MSTNSRSMRVDAGSVWRTLADGFSYAEWVVGTRRIREVDPAFPEIGSRLHYTVGHWPLEHHGATKVLDVDSGRRLELEVHAWPAAAIYVRLELDPAADGGTEVSITEHPSHGLGAILHNRAADLALSLRNVEMLRRLEGVAQRGSAPNKPRRSSPRRNES